MIGSSTSFGSWPFGAAGGWQPGEPAPTTYRAAVDKRCAFDELLARIAVIQRRLGGPRHQEARRLMRMAFDAHAGSGDVEPHRAWIAYLLTEYYDGMYTFQLSRKSDRIVFRGTHDDVCAYLHDVHGMEIHP